MTLPRWEDLDDAARERVGRFSDIAETWRACSDSIGRWFGYGPMVSETTTDLDYGTAGWFDKSFRSVERNFAASPYLRIAEAFVANMERVSAMHTLPLSMIYWVARNTKNNCAAAASLNLPVLEALSPEMIAKPEFARAVQELEVAESEAATNWGHQIPHSALAADFGANHIRRVLEQQPDSMRAYFVRGGVESILFSMVTSAYAAFETLATDLWIQAVNDHAAPLAVNWLHNHNRVGELSRSQKKLRIDLDDLSKYGFNVSGRMGQFLVDEEGASFGKLESIRSNYRYAFGPPAKALFEPQFPLYLAAKVRNLIAHRGGIIDEQFKRETASFPEYASQTGGHLLMTGKMVQQNVDACIGCALRLLHFTDDWTRDHAKAAS